MTNQSSLSAVTRILHIVIAISMIAMIAVGIYMHEFEVFALYDIHKSFGFIIFFVALARVLWRVKKGWPEALGEMSKAQHLIAKAIHWFLITVTVVYPLSGMMMSVGGGHGLAVFGIEVFAENVNAAGEAVAINGSIAGLGHELHELLTFVVIAAIVLHVAGALKHHYVDKDATLSRMFSNK